MDVQTETPEPAGVAERAAEIAVPFADQVAGRCAAIASGLRRGEDHVALTALTEVTEDLEHFLKFLVLICDYVSPANAEVAANVRTYQQELVEVIEGLQPALGSVDLVEIADAIEEDLVPSLRSYRTLDEVVQGALASG